MKVQGKIGINLLIPLILFFSSCSSIGPNTIVRDRIDYNAVLSDSWKEQMLLNIVRIRYGDAPIFLDVATVINSYELSGRANMDANWKFAPGNVAGGDAGIYGFYADRPTITYSPLSGERFAKSLMSPIPFSPILSIIQSGYRADLVLRSFVQSINGLENQYAGRHHADAGFYQLVERMKRIQDAGAFGLRVGSGNEGGPLMIVLRGKNNGEVENDITEVKKLLGLDLQTNEFKVVYGAIQADGKEIAILSRSMLQVLNEMAYYIDVPETDLAEKRVNPGFNNEPADHAPAPSLIKISSAPQRPADAFVAVPYQKSWFSIDNTDISSKQLFSFLMFGFALVETEGKEGAPVVTIPVR